MHRDVADDEDLLATGAAGIRQHQGVIERPGRADRFLGVDAMDRIHKAILQRFG
jgi:hypothetical protein